MNILIPALSPMTMELEQPRERVIELLRAELEEYGGLLNLLEDQQSAILQRAPDTLIELNAAIAGQVRSIQIRREQRENFVQDLAVKLDQPAASALLELLNYFREPVQPLLRALVDEINHLVTRARRRAHQNQMLLARSIEVMREVLHRLNPETVNKVYGADGRMLIGVPEVSPRCLARS